MHAQQQRLNQEFMEQSPLHASLWTALHEVVPHWNPRITRRFIQSLIPIWRDDLINQPSQLRYLQLAMRLGWFDEAASARKWTLFIELLENLTETPSTSTALNLFNLVAALPSLPPSLPLSDYLNAQLCAPDRDLDVADAACITACVAHILSGDYATDGSLGSARDVKHRNYFHLFEKKAFSEYGKGWLTHPWRAHNLTPIALLEPFGKDPWALVSKIGLDLAGRLVAYDLPQDRHTIINIEQLALFEPDIRSSEPIWEKQTSSHEPLPSTTHDLLLGPFVIASPTCVAGLTLTGAVALFQRS